MKRSIDFFRGRGKAECHKQFLNSNNSSQNWPILALNTTSQNREIVKINNVNVYDRFFIVS